MSVTNTLTYYDMATIMTVKSFIVQALWCHYFDEKTLEHFSFDESSLRPIFMAPNCQEDAFQLNKFESKTLIGKLYKDFRSLNLIFFVKFF
jgi:hypothetical protein